MQLPDARKNKRAYLGYLDPLVRKAALLTSDERWASLLWALWPPRLPQTPLTMIGRKLRHCIPLISWACMREGGLGFVRLFTLLHHKMWCPHFSVDFGYRRVEWRVLLISTPELYYLLSLPGERIVSSNVCESYPIPKETLHSRWYPHIGMTGQSLTKSILATHYNSTSNNVPVNIPTSRLFFLSIFILP